MRPGCSAASDPTLAVVLGVHQSIGYKGIHLFGTDEQKERFLPRLASGEMLAAYALTEKNAGSDAYHVETVATPQSDGSFLVSDDSLGVRCRSFSWSATSWARCRPSGTGWSRWGTSPPVWSTGAPPT